MGKLFYLYLHSAFLNLKLCYRTGIIRKWSCQISMARLTFSCEGKMDNSLAGIPFTLTNNLVERNIIHHYRVHLVNDFGFALQHM